MTCKKRIEQAARELFQREGYEGTSLRNIAREAHVGVSSIIYHFKSKADLYKALFPDQAGEKRESVRKKIEKEAKRMFARHGYDGVSIRDIAHQAGVNSASISYYFGSKGELYRQSLNSGRKLVDDFFRQVEKSHKGPRERLFLFESFFEDFAEKEPEQMHIFFWEQLHPTDIFSEEMMVRCVNVVDVITTAIQDGMDSGEFRKDINAVEAGIAWMGMVIYYFVVNDLRQNFHVGASVTVKSYMQEAFDIFIRGIENRPVEQTGLTEEEHK